MATKTVTELRNKVLQKLGVLAVGETASAEDASLVEDHYAALRDMLEGEGVATWADGDAIPREVWLPVAAIVASGLVGDFDLPSETRMELAAEARAAWVALRRQVSGTYSHNPVEAEYY